MITSSGLFGGSPAGFHAKELLHPATEHLPAGLTVLPEMAAEARHREQRVSGRRPLGERAANGRGVEHADLPRGECHLCGRVREGARDVPQQ